ncbi:MAG: hypothetical protein IKV35_07115 [Clostridia bacterium]|nr:hypothetical protein [Clostridia bacterium]
MKALKVVLIAVLAVVCTTVLLMVSVAAVFVYEEKFKKTEVYRECDPNGAYVFVLYEIGEPVWAFGPVKARIAVLDSRGKTVVKQDLSLNNDGSHVHELNVEALRWREGALEVQLKGFDDEEKTTYTLSFDA